MRIDVPQGVLNIVDRLQAEGFDAYAVGGCIRDSILGKSPLDWDITTPALPSQIIEIFNDMRQIQVGSRHGTVAVKSDGQYYEITTYRIDGTYADGRRPDNVSFTLDLREDLQRRDFTINAMAYSPNTGLVDHFGGLADLRAGIVRCVGIAAERFAEDYLRILRAYRFAATLDFSLENDTRKAAINGRHNLEKIARERVGAELSKLFVSQSFGAIKTFLDDCADVIFPEFAVLRDVVQANPYHLYSAYEHSLEVLRHTPNTLYQRLCAIFHDTGKAHTKTTDQNGVDHFYNHAEISEKIASESLQHWCFDNATKAKVQNLVALHDKILKPEKQAVKRFLNKYNSELLRELLIFQRADNLAKSEKAFERLKVIDETVAILEEILTSKEPFSIKDLALTGKEVMEIMGLTEGPAVGEKLSELLAAVLKNPQLNTKEGLKKLL
ncbi:MAG: CCA tRNA nucleotidyltransferase [Defluviitaleaceae bacterium]|nr:CCA tRNA nucleotidyltransferase [Defluviitaleaceae bacterium]